MVLHKNLIFASRRTLTETLKLFWYPLHNGLDLPLCKIFLAFSHPCLLQRGARRWEKEVALFESISLTLIRLDPVARLAFVVSMVLLFLLFLSLEFFWQVLILKQILSLFASSSYSQLILVNCALLLCPFHHCVGELREPFLDFERLLVGERARKQLGLVRSCSGVLSLLADVKGRLGPGRLRVEYLSQRLVRPWSKWRYGLGWDNSGLNSWRSRVTFF